MNKLDEIMKDYIKEFKYRVGDRVDVYLKVTEGDAERIQVFDGIIIAIRGSGVSKTFTIRKISYGVGVERTIPVNSPKIEKIVLIRSNKVRKAKLNYLRNLSGKAARLTEIVNDMEDDDSNEEAVVNQEINSGK
ncbi:MAG: 50S ribosomal protein L19 [Elusimicrobiales bacterium]|jgi:large subunit ribosomal protein L19|nr:50S ribosomal protein L19 [Elusimicrobiales bacterium]NLH39166.1 50S ribosomal protein L19 [Elusimicrobiota bacterium]